MANLQERRDKSGSLKHSTAVRYREMLEKRIYPEIGHIRLKDLRPDALNALYTALSADGINQHGGGALSGKTVLEHHRIIHTILTQAVREGLIPLNPADRVIPPKPSSSCGSTRHGRGARKSGLARTTRIRGICSRRIAAVPCTRIPSRTS